MIYTKDEIKPSIYFIIYFIFGINQLGNYTNNKNMSYEEREKYRYLRKFNTHCYGKLFNYKKVVSEARKHCKNNLEIFDNTHHIPFWNMLTLASQCKKMYKYNRC